MSTTNTTSHCIDYLQNSNSTTVLLFNCVCGVVTCVAAVTNTHCAHIPSSLPSDITISLIITYSVCVCNIVQAHYSTCSVHYTHTYIYTSMYIYIYTNACIYTHTHIYIHTYIHTCTIDRYIVFIYKTLA